MFCVRRYAVVIGSDRGRLAVPLCCISVRIRDDVGIVPYEIDGSALETVGVDAHIDPRTHRR